MQMCTDIIKKPFYKRAPYGAQIIDSQLHFNYIYTMKPGHHYLIKERIGINTSIQKVVCLEVTQKTYKLQFPEEVQYILKENFEVHQSDIEGWDIIEELGEVEQEATA